MANPGSRMHDAITAIVAYLTGALTGTEVLDGIPPRLITVPGMRVYVGGDSVIDLLASQSPFPTLADGSSDWRGLGAMHRAENFNVRCCIFALAQTGDVPTLRGQVFDLFADIDSAMRGNANLGGAIQYGGVSATQTRGGVGDRGVVCELQFTVICTALT